jgi:hypothetical protein
LAANLSLVENVLIISNWAYITGAPTAIYEIILKAHSLVPIGDWEAA